MLIDPATLTRLLHQVSKEREARRGAEALLEDLTDREREILQLLAEGMRNEGIAQKLFISPQTVQTHVRNLLAKLGVHTDGVGTTRFAGAFDVTRPLDPEVGNVVQAVIDKGYRDFTGRVAQARGRSVEQIDAIARGRVWSGAQARERGLVDQFGGLEDALADAATRARLGKPGDYQVHYIEKPATPFERFFTRFAQHRVAAAWLRDASLTQALLAHALPQARDDLRFLDSALPPAHGLHVKALAYCFCGL